MVERSVLLKGLQHPFLVGLHFSFQTSHTLVFVLDYINGGELFYHLQREGAFPEFKPRYPPGDLNILLDSGGHVVLTDFGLCKEGMSVGGTMQTYCGTPEYLAPEVLLGHAYSGAVDWWGLGSVLYEMLHGLPPFYSRSKAEMFENILHAPLQLHRSVSQSARSLLQGLLERDCTKRLRGEQDLAELQGHTFFLSINWDDQLARKVPPLFIPNLSGPCDEKREKYFDPEFTLLPVPASLGLSDMLGDVANGAFPGFSYMPPAEVGVTEP
ncbi:serine/threonine-protein kinase Sgk1-like [Salvelinus fontinalis]|uniref:serine/threonine-protein kinase Sgk1-like n=1 Tax=Salvelinus fontinalis TaxID=8038 RepID=UPI002485E436|nr:serine/threonine-protein kinase Sgk1-like [Salvelinus fontinalis]